MGSNFSRLDLAGVGLIAMSLLVFFLIVIAPLFLDSGSGGRQAVAGQSRDCNAPGHEMKVVDVILDNTDSVKLAHQEAVLSLIGDRARKAPAGQQWNIWEVKNDNDPPGPELSTCLPRSGQDANWLLENPPKIQERRDAALQVIAQQIRRSLSAEMANISPILGSINSVNMQRGEVGGRTLMLVSDLLENTAEYTHYRNGSDDSFAVFSKTGMFNRIKTDMGNVNAVELFYLRREGQEHRQRPEHLQNFWVPFFEAQGVEPDRIKIHRL